MCVLNAIEHPDYPLNHLVNPWAVTRGDVSADLRAVTGKARQKIKVRVTIMADPLSAADESVGDYRYCYWHWWAIQSPVKQHTHTHIHTPDLHANHTYTSPGWIAQHVACLLMGLKEKHPNNVLHSNNARANANVYMQVPLATVARNFPALGLIWIVVNRYTWS